MVVNRGNTPIVSVYVFDGNPKEFVDPGPVNASILPNVPDAENEVPNANTLRELNADTAVQPVIVATDPLVPGPRKYELFEEYT